MALRAAIDSDLLLRLMRATPEQYDAIAKILGCQGDGGWQMADGAAREDARPTVSEKGWASAGNGERKAHGPDERDLIQRVGRLAFGNGFADVWLGAEHFDLSRRAKARACLRYLVEQRAFDAESARHLGEEIDPFVRAHCQLPALPGYGELKIHHYFNPSTSDVARLGRELIRPAGRNGRFYLNVN